MNPSATSTAAPLVAPDRPAEEPAGDVERSRRVAITAVLALRGLLREGAFPPAG